MRLLIVQLFIHFYPGYWERYGDYRGRYIMHVDKHNYQNICVLNLLDYWCGAGLPCQWSKG